MRISMFVLCSDTHNYFIIIKTHRATKAGSEPLHYVCVHACVRTCVRACQ